MGEHLSNAASAQTLEDARKPMHTDPSTIWVIDIREQRKNDTRFRTSSIVPRGTSSHPERFAMDAESLE
jgi:hypothetical protein